ncbi:hypothetical protein ONZ45_g12254 [Pleurotus djamor]|nr:hypothetical protein ONZ45_g12254 [Pleurotus djamor]
MTDKARISKASNEAENVLQAYLNEEDSLEETTDQLIQESLEDFPEEDDNDDAARYATQVARACITSGTRTGHLRIAKAYIIFHRRLDRKWDPKAVTKQTPRDITKFITHKCGDKQSGYQGCRFATAVSCRAALTFWYRHIRPNESTVDWRVDTVTEACFGLPTRSRLVADFMTGLEKTKAKSGEVSRSARALTLQDMYRLYSQCFPPSGNDGEIRAGISAYLFAWLLLLRIEEVLRLTFESIEVIPQEREYFEVYLHTRKSAQTGLSHGWRLYANDKDPRICPMRALIRLARLYNKSVPRTGPLFLKVSKQGTFTAGDGMTPKILSNSLSTDLQALGYTTWALYGTHSFRRGGCQHRVKNKSWSIDMVAAWGGWSQAEAITMFRYFYSPNDNHEHMIEYDRNH